MLVDRGEARRVRLRDQRGAGRDRARPGYWRDVGTLDAYYDAHMDLISVHPVFNLYNSDWPIHTWLEPLPPAKFVHDDDDRRGHAMDSMVCAGVVVSGSVVRRSVLSPGVHVNSFALVEDAILMHQRRGWPRRGGTQTRSLTRRSGRARR